MFHEVLHYFLGRHHAISTEQPADRGIMATKEAADDSLYENGVDTLDLGQIRMIQNTPHPFQNGEYLPLRFE